MIKYPKSLDTIFHKLYKNNITPVIVGGYIRDNFLHVSTNDIDIELYGVASLDTIEKILKEFGNVNSVGKSFGVCKLSYKGLDLDFSLPRKDNKIASGHQGFNISLIANLDFKTAASRRDFTINAIGYDVKNKKILDPFDGRKDLHNKILKAVDNKKFGEDPLRVLRAVVFASRFDLVLDKSLELTCKKMIQNRLLDELPKERIFQEIKKLLLKSDKPSSGFYLLKKLGGFSFFQEFDTLSNTAYKEILDALQKLKNFHITNEKEFVTLALALLTSKFSQTQTQTFLKRITNEKTVIEKVFTLHQLEFNLNNFSNYDIYQLATKIDIELYCYYLHVTDTQQEKIDSLYKQAKKLGVLHKALVPLIGGKDLIELGLEPSQEFSNILSNAYEAQMQDTFKDKQAAITWLKKQLLQF
ncbi:CCA tRNA nucleotidyltransferase [Sulfurimonas sp.]